MENKLQKTETKYYIPQISEFFEGFEYEVYKPGTDTEYEKKTYTLMDCLVANSYKNLIHEGWLRVKCLDRTDIKELGWEQESVRWHYAHKTGRYKLICDIWTESAGFPVPHPNSGSIKIIDNRDGDDFSVFYGYIRNKSELRKIMEHLDIIQFKPLNLL